MASLFTGTVEEYPSFASLPLVGVADTIYITTDTNILYRWDTTLSAYAELSPNIVTSLVFSDANGFDGTISLVGSVATLTITTALTTGSVPFIGTSGALSQDNDNFFWDDTNNRLGIGTKLPTTALDVFGSGIIGRINGTSTNNAFLGFASAGTNKWSIGNVQSDHRFRIYNEATTSELVSVLQTGEFGIGIANPTTKLHIDGGASALIANLDANVSVAKSISFRSDNSARINLEVSGTESGSNAGMDFFLRTYTDAGALLETPFSIVRSTGVTTIKSLTLTNALSVSSGGTGAATFTAGRILFGNGTSALNTSANLFWDNTNSRLGIGTVTPNSPLHVLSSSVGLLARFESNQAEAQIRLVNTGTSGRSYSIGSGSSTSAAINGFYIYDETSSIIRFSISSTGNFGFGTASPTSISTFTTLEIRGTTGGGIKIGKTSTAQLNIQQDGTDAYFNNTANGSMYFYTNDAERMKIAADGSFTIGITANQYGRLAIKSNSTTSYGGLNVYANGNTNFVALNHDNNVAWVTSEFATGTGAGFTPLAFAIGGTQRMRIDTSGNITFGVTSAYDTALLWRQDFTGSIQGRIYSTGAPRVYVTCNESGGVYLTSGATSWTANSDERLKNINSEIENAVEKLSKLRAVNFSWKSDESNKENLGLIAQDVEKQFPQLIDKGELAITEKEEQTDKTEYLGVRYQELIPVLVAAIKELKAEIDTLKAK
jgi:hypothetical protein